MSRIDRHRDEQTTWKQYTPPQTKFAGGIIIHVIYNFPDNPHTYNTENHFIEYYIINANEDKPRQFDT